MFSSHIIWAIYILTELDKVIDPESKLKGMEISTGNSMQKAILRSVLKKLTASGYIARTSGYNRYCLIADLSKVSIYELVQLFHGDICIGEIYDHNLTIGKEKFFTDEFQNFLNHEHNLKESICREMQNISLGSLKNS